MGWRLRLCWLMLAVPTAAMPQGFSFGVKGGVPINDALKVLDRSRYFSDKAPYVIGPAVELRLIGGVSAESGVFYRKVQYTPISSTGVASRVTGQIWEIPILAKYRAPGALIRPTISAGLSYRRLARFRQRTSSGTVSVEPPEVVGRSTAGATLGGGVELSVPLLRLSAELRYTRWGSTSIRSGITGLATQLNQADFLLGVMF